MSACIGNSCRQQTQKGNFPSKSILAILLWPVFSLRALWSSYPGPHEAGKAESLQVSKTRKWRPPKKACGKHNRECWWLAIVVRSHDCFVEILRRKSFSVSLPQLCQWRHSTPQASGEPWHLAEDREDLLGQGRRGGKVEEKDDRSRQGKKAVSDRSTVAVWEWSRPWGGGPQGRTKLPGITELENRSHFHCDFGK